jgi:hypothetical protein
MSKPKQPILKSVTFRASIPPIESAIKIHGEQGARLTLDVADVDLQDFFPVTALRGSVLTITIEAKRGK